MFGSLDLRGEYGGERDDGRVFTFRFNGRGYRYEVECPELGQVVHKGSVSTQRLQDENGYKRWRVQLTPTEIDKDTGRELLTTNLRASGRQSNAAITYVVTHSQYPRGLVNVVNENTMLCSSRNV